MMFARMALALVLTAGLSSIARAEDIRCPASAAPARPVSRASSREG